MIHGTIAGRAAALAAMLAILVALPGCGPSDPSAARLADGSDGADWPGYGRTFGQQHYSPLTQIGQANVGRLGLAWSMDLPPENSATQPIAVNGILYFATGLSIVHAVDAVTGKELWSFDPEVATKAGGNLRLGWGVRGVAWWGGRIYTGTQDGRLIAIDAAKGKQVWSVQTTDPTAAAHVNGAPRVYDGKVIVGFGSSDGVNRGYVTAYDAATGAQIWRFFTTPGDPARGFENDAMRMAAKTWAGDWWKFGGGGTVWNAIAYDPDTDTVFIGTGSPYPWNRRIRSQDKGDNLFVSSIVALRGATGAYKWHYQTTPGDTWDFDATMDIELADIRIDGKPRKVVIQAPKNGFFYVIDRITGKLLSAQPITKTTWASRVDLRTGRPVEIAGARYPGATMPDIWPTSLGAHNWMSMSFSPRTKLAYIPAVDFGAFYKDDGTGWTPPVDHSVSGGMALIPHAMIDPKARPAAPGRLIAWSPVTQKAIWSAPYPTYLNGGAVSTGGGLVLQGSIDGRFRAFDDRTGKLLWNYDARAPILATPISYMAHGKQYITVLTGLGMGYATNAAALLGPAIEKYGINPQTEARRVLTFAIGGTSKLAAATPIPTTGPDPEFKRDDNAASAGAQTFARHCATCHGAFVVASGHAPDLRRSSAPQSSEAFASVVRDGALIQQGMPAFDDLPDLRREEVRQYIRTESMRLRSGSAGAKGAGGQFIVH